MYSRQSRAPSPSSIPSKLMVHGNATVTAFADIGELWRAVFPALADGDPTLGTANDEAGRWIRGAGRDVDAGIPFSDQAAVSRVVLKRWVVNGACRSDGSGSMRSRPS